MSSLRRAMPQLVPLLDLLLLLVFTMLFVMQDAVEKQGTLASEAATARMYSLDRVKELEMSLASLESKMEETESENRDLRDRIGRADRAEQDNATLQTALKDLGQLVKDSLRIPDDAIEPFLQDISALDAKRLRDDLKGLQSASPGDAIRVIRKYGELTKRADFWQVYIDSQDQVSVRVGDDDVISGCVPRSEEEARQILETQLRNVVDPKPLVIVIVTWGDAHGDVVDDTRKALEAICASSLPNYFKGNQRFIVSGWGRSDTKPWS